MKATYVAIAAALILSGCDFSPAGVAGRDRQEDENQDFSYAPPKMCDEFDSYADEKSPGCETPSDDQVTVARSDEDGKLVVTLSPDAFGAVPMVMGLWYRVYVDGSSIDDDAKAQDVPLNCSPKAGAAGPNRVLVCSFSSAYASGATHVPEIGTTLSRFYMIQVKHPVCDNSRYLQVMREACGGAGPVPANIAAPRIYLTLTGQP